LSSLWHWQQQRLLVERAQEIERSLAEPSEPAAALSWEQPRAIRSLAPSWVALAAPLSAQLPHPATSPGTNTERPPSVPRGPFRVIFYAAFADLACDLRLMISSRPKNHASADGVFGKDR